MKRVIAILLAAVMVITLASCGDGGSGGKGKTTLMIYMIGSDLESKSGAATDDLMEIQESGIDTGKNDVVVYSGGCATWQNGTVNSEENSILSLNSDGYTVEKTEALVSMGEADTLSGFLNYCTENHPADHYALILWNHGNGPLIGYGKDTLYDNDSLTLSEMGKALEDSPFGCDTKLDWVGFDACLMASAELSCLWDDYADYLIASQEVEPAFGWNYGFLADLGKTDAEDLAGSITQKYLDACLEYFEKKDYKDRDTTLAYVDLAYSDELKDAVNGLFAAGKEAYCRVSCINSDITITGMQKMAIEFRSAENSTILWQGYGDVNWEEVELSKKSDAPTKIEPGDTTLMDQDGVTVKLVSYEETEYNKTWKMTLESKREEGVRIDFEDLKVNGTSYNDPDSAPVYMYRAQTGPGQITYIEIATSSLMSAMSWEDVKDVALKFVVYDFTGEKILFRTKDDVNLKAE